MTDRVVLVTGASSGIGRAIAARLAGAGYRVFGTSRNPQAAAVLPGVTMLPLDVTDQASADACVAAVLAAAGRLDVLVNNAGIAVVGAVEEVTLADARRQFDTNFFGAFRMIQAALPTMRGQRSGAIINISSVAGLLAIPFGGLYSASKFALEGLSESLRAELAHLGIRVVLVEPGFYKSDLVQEATLNQRRIDDYGAVESRVLQQLRAIEAASPPPTAVAELVLTLIGQPAPALRHAIGKEKIFVTLKRFLPAALFEPQEWKFWKVTV